MGAPCENRGEGEALVYVQDVHGTSRLTGTVKWNYN